MKTKLAILFKELARKLALILRLIGERRWRFARVVTKQLFTGLWTLHCVKCGASSWYWVSKTCGTCGMMNLLAALNDVEDEPCVSCGKPTSEICENCEAPLCFDCDSKKFHDVLTCKDEVGCSERCGVNQAEAANG